MTSYSLSQKTRDSEGVVILGGGHKDTSHPLESCKPVYKKRAGAGGYYGRRCSLNKWSQVPFRGFHFRKRCDNRVTSPHVLLGVIRKIDFIKIDISKYWLTDVDWFDVGYLQNIVQAILKYLVLIEHVLSKKLLIISCPKYARLRQTNNLPIPVLRCRPNSANAVTSRLTRKAAPPRLKLEPLWSCVC